MSTFPGESLGLWDAVNTTGTPVATWEDIAYRAGSSTFTAGDEAVLSVNMGSHALVNVDTTGVTIAYAIVVLSGTGTLAGTESGDIAGGGSLGSVNITGAGTYLLPSTVTVADILGNGDADLALECTSGTVVVQQVKLRVWPAGGVVGGWSDPFQHDDYRLDIGSWRASGFAYVIGVSDFTGATGPEVITDMQTAQRAAVAADTIGTPAFVGSPNTLVADFIASATEYDGGTPPARSFVGDIGLGVAYSLHPAPVVGAEIDPPGFFGTDWVYPPDEVVNDPDLWDVTGDDAWAWWQGQGTIRVQTSDDLIVSGNVNAAVEYVEDVDDPSTSWAAIATGPAASVNAAAGADDERFDLPPAQATGLLRFTSWHDGAFAEQEIAFSVPDGGDPPGVTYYTGYSRAGIATGIYDNREDTSLDRIAYRYTPAPFRYWVPSVARVIPLRQLHLDNGMGMTPPRAYGGTSIARTGRRLGDF